MFEQAEQGAKLSDRRYDAAVLKLRWNLLKTHFAMRDARRQVIVVVSGADGAGKGELVHRFNEWLDPRGVVTHAFWDASDEEAERPHFFRFWRAMPGNGRVGIFFGSWYSRPIIERVMHERKRREFDAEMDRILGFEKMLAESGTVLVKFWMHLSRPEQKARLKSLEKSGRIGPDDWKHFESYKRFRSVSERALQRTDAPGAPWHVIEATDRRYREVTAGRILLKALKEAAGKGPGASADAEGAEGAAVIVRPRGAHPGTRPGAQRRAAASAPPRWTPGPSRLDKVDLTQRLPVAAYERELSALQNRLSRLAWAAREAKRATVLVFEGWDAGGKGSAIRRVTQAIDPRLYRVVGIAAPTEEERAQHYLWRFWRHVPRDGRITIFDRSWYGRVLVERVEGFAPVADWDRAFGEIVDFERQLTDHGSALAKFWIHISPEEQLKRFKERQRVPWKQFKITDEDWRNREKMPAYREAVEEMLERCSPADAPWTLVAGNDKRFARVQIVRTIVERLEAALG